MTILCEFTPTGGEMIRASMSDFSNLHLWKSYITSLPSVKISMPNAWGGYAAPPQWADLSFSPDMFTDTDNWPPPDTATIRLLWIDGDDETESTVIWDGTAILSEMPYDSIKYRIARIANATKIPASTAFADTLANVMTTLCGSSYLNLSLDTSRARIPSPAVSHTTSAEILTVDLISDMCAFFGHGCYVEGRTLYLIDMYDTTTTQTTIDSGDVLPSSGPKYGTRYSTAKCGDYSAASATVTNGEELSISTAYHGTESNIEAALAILLDIANRPQVELSAIVGESPIKIGGCYLFNDENHAQSLQSIFVVSDIVYNFDSDQLQATGAGVVA